MHASSGEREIAVPPQTPTARVSRTSAPVSMDHGRALTSSTPHAHASDSDRRLRTLRRRGHHQQPAKCVVGRLKRVSRVSRPVPAGKERRALCGRVSDTSSRGVPVLV